MELIANGIVETGGIKRYVVMDELTIFENYENLFGQKGMQILLYSFRNHGDGNFYLLQRYQQCVGLVQYNRQPKSIHMTIFEIKDMDTFLDSFVGLQADNWKEADLTSVGNIVQDIIENPSDDLLTISIKKIF